MSMLPLHKETILDDIKAGFLTFLIALPLCLGIALASGFPAIAGILTAIVGGMLVSFVGSSRLTIKGPAAGMIVICLGAVNGLGGGLIGYKRALAVGVVAGLLQMVLARLRAGVLGAIMPKSVIHGMLAAIGVIILAKQSHVLLGVTPHAKTPLHLLMEIPHSISHANISISIIGVISLLLLFVFSSPKLPSLLKKIPPAILVLVFAVVVGRYFMDLEHAHHYQLFGIHSDVGPQFLLHLPANILKALVFPDFSKIFTLVSLQYIVLYVLVGSIESLLTVSAVDNLDPEKKTSDLNKDLMATGIGNTLVAFIGGLPMISEVVRSKANIDQGAKSEWANFFHGLFLLVFVAVFPQYLQIIPLAALAALLVYTGIRLASPSEFMHAYHVGKDQIIVFSTTFLLCLVEDLLVGVFVGILVKLFLHATRIVPWKSIFVLQFKSKTIEGIHRIRIFYMATFINFLFLEKHLKSQSFDEKSQIEIDLSKTYFIDHTFFTKLQELQHNWKQGTLVITGLEEHIQSSQHPEASRIRPRKTHLTHEMEGFKNNEPNK